MCREKSQLLKGSNDTKMRLEMSMGRECARARLFRMGNFKINAHVPSGRVCIVFPKKISLFTNFSPLNRH